MVLWAPPVKLWTCAAARGTSGGKAAVGGNPVGKGTSCRRSLVFPIYFGCPDIDVPYVLETGNQDES